MRLFRGTVIRQTTITAIPKPIAASIFFEIAINVHIPRNTDKAIFSINTVVINIFR
jgi:hypothetical protein